jgi:hypothetical protein
MVPCLGGRRILFGLFLIYRKQQQQTKMAAVVQFLDHMSLNICTFP